MPDKISRLRNMALTAALIPILALTLAACGTPTPIPTPAPKPDDAPTPAAMLPNTPIPNPPAITEPTAPAPEPSGAGNTGMAAPNADTSTWTPLSRTAEGTTYSYRYPPGWTPDLSWCAPGAARSTSASQLPARCAATDILVGQKARDVGTLTGENITLSGKQATRQIDRAPRNGQAEVIYTVMVYDPSGTALAGFSTSIGPRTDTATVNNIISMLNAIAATLVVSR